MLYSSVRNNYVGVGISQNSKEPEEPTLPFGGLKVEKIDLTELPETEEAANRFLNEFNGIQRNQK